MQPYGCQKRGAVAPQIYLRCLGREHLNSFLEVTAGVRTRWRHHENAGREREGFEIRQRRRSVGIKEVGTNERVACHIASWRTGRRQYLAHKRGPDCTCCESTIRR